MCMYMCACVRACMCVYVYVCVCEGVYVYVRACMYVCVRACMCVYMRACVWRGRGGELVGYCWVRLNGLSSIECLSEVTTKTSRSVK